MRTNIDIDDDLVAIIMRRYGLNTKTAAVDLALRRLAGLPLLASEARAMYGANAIDAAPEDVGP